MSKCFLKSRLDFFLLCLCFLTACSEQSATYTDCYYISNETSGEICLVTECAVVWDTCAPANIQRAWYSSNSIRMSSGQTVRLHPIAREYKLATVGDKMNVVPCLGMSTRLTIENDTVSWQTERPYMFYDDTVWSIYNTRDWTTEKDKEYPYTFHHTFVITQENIERAIQ